MTDPKAGERSPPETEPSKRPWAAPTIEVVRIDETEGPGVGFPKTDAITGVS
jgi:hypothetical protein